MKIGFLSDTHGYLEDTNRALKILENCDVIIHLGDVLAHGPRNKILDGYAPKELAEVLAKRDDIEYISGNCDADVDSMVTGKDISSKAQFMEVDDLKIYATHGYLEDEEERIETAKALKANLVVTGHSHIKELEKFDDMVFLNPGSTSLPKDGSKSVAMYSNGEFQLINLDTGETIKSLKLKENL